MYNISTCIDINDTFPYASIRKRKNMLRLVEMVLIGYDG
jgi:hypothetical protein